jgi:putative ABC transport system permease protein
MFGNYYKIAFRNLLKNKGYSAINILGLAVGMAVALLIGLWILDEWSFDRFHSNHKNIAQVMNTRFSEGEGTTTEQISIPVSTEFRTHYAADFKRVAMVFLNYTHVLAVGDKKISQSGVWAQPDFPEMLDLKMITGRQDALKDPSSTLISRSVAFALFGNEDPMNKIIRLDNMADVKVAGVFEDLPENTTFYNTRIFLAWDKAITTFGGGIKDSEQEWTTRGWRLFVEMNDHVDMAKVSAEISGLINKHVPGANETLTLHPMDRWHLYSEFKNGVSTGGRIRLIWLFGIIGIFVLLLACINFMNLSTARSEKRAKEVGIRKAVGSLRGQLVGQFLSESLLVAFISCALALLVVQLMVPSFNRMTDKTMFIPWNEPFLWIFTLGFTFFTGLISGSYPAFYLSGFESVKVLKGSFKAGRNAALPRKALVVAQFTVSIVLIIGTMIVFRQIKYAQQRPVGYSREGLIMVNMNTPELYDTPYNLFRETLKQTNAVTEMSRASNTSTEAPIAYQEYDWEGKTPGSKPFIGMMAVTHDIGKVLNWQLISGRDFSRDLATDTGAIIVNESAAKLVGPAREILFANKKPHKIIGVVRDMVMESPYKLVQPAVFVLDYKWSNVMLIRLNGALPARTALARIEPVFRHFNPGSEFNYTFVDEAYAQKFSDETRVGNIATFFAILAIFISCLGLFGLASFVAEQRTKEIGVRKVLGASVFNLWQLLSREFILLVVISCLIAGPIAIVGLNKWLDQYNYRTFIPWWIFAVAGLGVLVITLLTVSYQALRAALMNPVKSLKTE